MLTHDKISEMSIYDIIDEAIRQEMMQKDFYERAGEEVGPDAQILMRRFSIQHEERIAQLRRLMMEIRELRELTAAIAD